MEKKHTGFAVVRLEYKSIKAADNMFSLLQQHVDKMHCLQFTEEDGTEHRPLIVNDVTGIGNIIWCSLSGVPENWINSNEHHAFVRYCDICDSNLAECATVQQVEDRVEYGYIICGIDKTLTMFVGQIPCDQLTNPEADINFYFGMETFTAMKRQIAKSLHIEEAIHNATKMEVAEETPPF